MNNFQSANNKINQLAGVTKPLNKNTMKTTTLNKAYSDFKLQLEARLIKARKEYSKDRTGYNYDTVMRISHMLETIDLMKSDIQDLSH